MDNATLAIFIHELRNQCLYTEAAFRVFNQSLKDNVPAGVFFAAQSTLLTASQISSVLWPARARAKKRGESLRKVLQLPEKHSLNDKRLSTIWEHSDEKLEDWIGDTKGRQIVFDHLGPISAFDEKEVADDSVYRLYDPTTSVFFYRGSGYKMQVIASAITDIYTRLTAVHKEMFPQHYEASDAPANDGDTPAVGAKKEEKAKPTKKPAKKAAAKKPAKAKTPAKKATAKKK